MKAPDPVIPAVDTDGKPRLMMIGGFLGAGKTTAVTALAAALRRQGLKVALVTNDQGRNLVDTALLRSQGFATEEIAGGCFCCRFNALLEATRKLSEPGRPDVYLAEPVGSCTDLVATVTYPLRRLHAESFTVAPVSVLVDPIRALQVFGLEAGRGFSEKVLYIFRKQLEEADLVVISKCDLVDAGRLKWLQGAIAGRFPGKEIFAVSSRQGTNLEAWLTKLSSAQQEARKAIAVDYETYAEGEARLGWLNCTVLLAAVQVFDGNKLLEELATQVQMRLRAEAIEVAHLKITLSDTSPNSELGVVNLVRNEAAPELSLRLRRQVAQGRLIVNLRAEGAPAFLGRAMQQSIHAAASPFPTLDAQLDHLEHFRPGRPTPTYRFESVAA